MPSNGPAIARASSGRASPSASVAEAATGSTSTFQTSAVLTSHSARDQAVLLVMERDSETTFAAAVVRDLVGDAVVIASVDNPEHVARVHRAGADFVLSVGQVAGQVLSFQLLGEDAVSLQPEIKVVKTRAGALAGQRLRAAQVRQRTGCLVIAVERGAEVVVEFPDDFVIAADDRVYVSGTPATIAAYFAAVPGSRA